MSMYVYSGPATGFTFREKDGDTTEVMLFPGRQVTLPSCPEVDTLVALKRLTPVDTDAPAAPTAAAAIAKEAIPAAPTETVLQPATEAPVDTGATSAGASVAPIKKGA